MSQVKALIRDSIKAKETLLAGDGPHLIEQMADAVVAALRAGGRIFICGNGGSAADAQHIAGEFIGRFMMERAPLPCVALTTDTSVLTCVANDYSFDDIFARQVKGLVKPGDIFIGLSTSGNSVNVLRAAKAAKDLGAMVLAFTGRDGGKLAGAADLCLIAPATLAARIQEVHITCLHILCHLVERAYFG